MKIQVMFIMKKIYRKQQHAIIIKYASPFGQHIVDRVKTNWGELDIAKEFKHWPKRVFGPFAGLKAGYKKMLDVLAPYGLVMQTLMNWISFCESPLKRNETETFLKALIAGEKNWVTNNDKVGFKKDEHTVTIGASGWSPLEKIPYIWWNSKGCLSFWSKISLRHDGLINGFPGYAENPRTRCPTTTYSLIKPSII